MRAKDGQVVDCSLAPAQMVSVVVMASGVTHLVPAALFLSLPTTMEGFLSILQVRKLGS